MLEMNVLKVGIAECHPDLVAQQAARGQGGRIHLTHVWMEVTTRLSLHGLPNTRIHDAREGKDRRGPEVMRLSTGYVEAQDSGFEMRSAVAS